MLALDIVCVKFINVTSWITFDNRFSVQKSSCRRLGRFKMKAMKIELLPVKLGEIAQVMMFVLSA